MKKTKMLVYVSSPFGAVKKYYKNKSFNSTTAIDLEATSIAHRGCLRVKEMGHIPISPIESFYGVYDEETEREQALEAGLEILKKCDALFWCDSKYSKYSRGMRTELKLAQKLKMPILNYPEDFE